MKGKGKSFEPKDLERIGISLPENLLNKFDRITKTRGYSSRSEGVRDAIRAYIAEWTEQEEQEAGKKVGTITYIYDHSQRGLGDELTEIQHCYMDIIRAAIHLHLNEENCLEVIIVKGETKEIKKLAEDIMSLKGVKNVKLSGTRLSAIHGGL